MTASFSAGLISIDEHCYSDDVESVGQSLDFKDIKYVLDISLSGGGLWAYIARETIGRGRSPRPIVSSAIMPINHQQAGRYLIYTMDVFDVLKKHFLNEIADHKSNL